MKLLAIACVGLGAALLGSTTLSPASTENSIPTAEVQHWRSMGPEGLAVVLNLEPHSFAANPSRRDGSIPKASPETQKWRAIVDEVAGQHDGWASKLYWYTDLEQAKEVARKEGKPILSLRLLGRLTDEYSCANSRFFRKTLYPNDEVGKYLRDHFILHWESVRPVPVVTIDFGDGRKLKRTITGNSIHYVLDAEGRIVDALPGLYSPKAFLAGLRPAEVMARKCGPLSKYDRRTALIAYHTERLTSLHSKIADDLKRTPVSADDADKLWAALMTPVVPGIEASPNRKGEALLHRLRNGNAAFNVLPDRNLRVWESLALLNVEDVNKDRAALTLIAQRPVQRANPLALPKSGIEGPLVDNVQLAEFSRNRALDTVYNEYGLHHKIHQALSQEWTLNQPLATFTAWCYAGVFLAPLDDPWYGLKSESFDGYDEEPVVNQQAAIVPGSEKQLTAK